MFGTDLQVARLITQDCPDLPQRIREAREADPRHLSVIAREAGMTRANWYRIENGEIKRLPVETLRRIEQVLGVSFGIDI